MKKNVYYIIAFIEGASVMAIELAGAKMIAPFYGTSLYVWAAVLAVTLGGLTTGYFLGGRATYRFPGPKLLFIVLLAGTLCIALMPILALRITPSTMDMGLRTGALLSTTCFMFLPLICMGMISPIIIQLKSAELKGTGKTAGTVYAISTIGGIIMTLLMGFYLLPEWGIRKSVFLTAGLLGAMPVLLFIITRSFKGLAIASLTGLLLIVLASAKPFQEPESDIQVQYQTEGILGQVSVLDITEPKTRYVFRHLLLNYIPQTKMNVDVIPASAWFYPHRLATLASFKQRGSKVLLIGLGGGTIATELKKMGFKVDIVEIDDRMEQVSHEYFGFDPSGSNIYIDDGRHFLKTTKEKYDIVVTDVLNGEVQPYHLFTQEAFADLKKILNPDALVLINYQGYVNGPKGRSARSIYKTLQESGFKMKYFYSGNDVKDGDIHFIASLKDMNFSLIDTTRQNECCKIMQFKYANLVTDAPLSLDDAMVFTDDKPMLEVMNNSFIEEWRRKSLNLFLKNITSNDIPFFR